MVNIKKKTNEEFLMQMQEINENIEILSEYIDATTYVKCRCKIDGYEWDARPYNLISGKGCKQCHYRHLKESRIKPHEKFINEMKSVNSNIEIIGIYGGHFNDIQCECLIHNETFFSKPCHLLRGQTGCKKCVDIKNHESGLKTHEQFLLDLYNVNQNIDVIGTYNGAKNKIKVKCKKCGYEWEPQATSLLMGCGCPGCTFSKGEEKINKYLNDNNIILERQKKYPDLKGVSGMPLSYDFYLPTYNLLIEYQGQFHDGTASIQTKEGFDRQKQNDLIKKQYTIQNNINFLEIWYYDFDNIDDILFKYINNLKNPVTTTVA